MSAKNITTEKMNTAGFSSGGNSDNAGRGPRVLTPQPQRQSAKGPGRFGGKESKNSKNGATYKG